MYTILLVDDIPANLELLTSYLSGKYKSAIAKNGETAIQRAELLNPALILLDIQMPGIDGYETCRRLKLNPLTRNIPVIFMTALTESTNKVRGFEVGGVDYVTKPVDGAELIARIDTHIQLHAMREELRLKNEALEINTIRQKRVEQILRHDLKSPLQGLFSIPDILLADSNLTDEQIELIHCINDSAKSMLEIIDSSLLVYRMENGTYATTSQSIDVKDSIHRVIQTLQPSLDALKIGITVNGTDISHCRSFPVLGEELLLKMLFSNLLKNAYEASPKNEMIRIRISNIESTQVSIRITNKGEVPLEIRERFFDELVTSGKEYGTGLGTYTAQLICRTLNGSIELDSSIEGETTLAILLPSA